MADSVESGSSPYAPLAPVFSDNELGHRAYKSCIDLYHLAMIETRREIGILGIDWKTSTTPSTRRLTTAQHANLIKHTMYHLSVPLPPGSHSLTSSVDRPPGVCWHCGQLHIDATSIGLKCKALAAPSIALQVQGWYGSKRGENNHKRAQVARRMVDSANGSDWERGVMNVVQDLAQRLGDGHYIVGAPPVLDVIQTLQRSPLYSGWWKPVPALAMAFNPPYRRGAILPFLPWPEQPSKSKKQSHRKASRMLAASLASTSSPDNPTTASAIPESASLPLTLNDEVTDPAIKTEITDPAMDIEVIDLPPEFRLADQQESDQASSKSSGRGPYHGLEDNEGSLGLGQENMELAPPTGAQGGRPAKSSAKGERAAKRYKCMKAARGELRALRALEQITKGTQSISLAELVMTVEAEKGSSKVDFPKPLTRQPLRPHLLQPRGGSLQSSSPASRNGTPTSHIFRRPVPSSIISAPMPASGGSNQSQSMGGQRWARRADSSKEQDGGRLKGNGDGALMDCSE